MLEINNVKKSYKKNNWLFSNKRQLVLENINLSIGQGQCLGLIGESGSGKSTLGRLILGLEKPDKGEILFEGHPTYRLENRSEKISAVFQDYTSSINPRLVVEEAISEPLKLKRQMTKEEIKHRVFNLLHKVGLKDNLAKRYPHELSGGQAQRVCIARAVATNPKFIVLDEAVSSLDVSAQIQILDLLLKLREELKMAYLFITHDIQAVTYICDSVLFLKSGQFVEKTRITNLNKVSDPYAKLLLSSVVAF